MATQRFRIGRSHTGLGMFATKPFKRRDYIATYRGPHITNEESEKREQRGATYMFALSKTHTIDGSPRYNTARYINHSCRPNAEPVGRNGGIVIIASKKIEPGEEITYDYGTDYYKYFVEAGGCQCAWHREKKARKRRKARMLAKAGKKARKKTRKRSAAKRSAAKRSASKRSATKRSASKRSARK